MPKAYIPNNYETLLKEHLELRKTHEASLQELYDADRELKVFRGLQTDYQNEIQLLQCEESNGIAELKRTIKKLQENITQLKTAHSNSILALEKEDELKSGQIEVMLKEIDSLKANRVIVVESDDSLPLLEELQNAKEENACKDAEIEALQAKIDSCDKLAARRDSTLKESLDEIANLKETLECKRSELSEAKDLIQNLNDDLMVLKSELETLKSKPLDNGSQGNSLFAEVDDRRVYLQNTISTMKSTYIEMQAERSLHLKEIAKLRRENGMLLARWKDDLSEIDDDKCDLMYFNKTRIEDLEKQVAYYKETLNKKARELFFQDMLESKKREIENLLSRISSHSLKGMSLTQSLAKSNRENRKLRKDGFQLQQTIELLKTKLEQLGETEVDKLIEFVPKIELETKLPDLWENLKPTENPIYKFFPPSFHQPKSNEASPKKEEVLKWDVLNVWGKNEAVAVPEVDELSSDEIIDVDDSVIIVEEDKENVPEKKSVKFSDDVQEKEGNKRRSDFRTTKQPVVLVSKHFD